MRPMLRAFMELDALMTRKEIEEAMQRYQANGGKVQQVPEGARTIDDGLRHCRCGCRGNYKEHSMRLGEMGK